MSDEIIYISVCRSAVQLRLALFSSAHSELRLAACFTYRVSNPKLKLVEPELMESRRRGRNQYRQTNTISQVLAMLCVCVVKGPK